jgi:hypothetical protein
VPFEQPGRQFVTQQTSAALALVKGNELVLFRRSEHALEGVIGGGEPLLPQLFPVIAW